jgi:hypothetical protein
MPGFGQLVSLQRTLNPVIPPVYMTFISIIRMA